MNTQNMEEKYPTIPLRLISGLLHWIHDGQPCGHFLMSVLKNDLFGAFTYADYESRECIHDILKLLYNHAPAQCWGSENHVKEWPAALAKLKAEKRHEVLAGV